MRWALAIYLAMLIGLTFLPFPPLPWDGPAGGAPLDLNLRPFRTIDRSLELGPGSPQFRLLVGNILAFVPFGVLLPLARRRRPSWPFAFGGALALTVAIELGQLGMSALIGSAYRSADIDDVILNVLGAMIGYAGLRAVAAVAASRSP